jgi:hypothetical protein
VVVGTFVVLLAVLGLVRQLVIARPRGGFDCTAWRPTWGRSTGWHNGLMRFGRDELRWYRAFSLLPAPEFTIRRSQIEDLVRRPLPAQDGSELSILMEFLLVDAEPVRVMVTAASSSAVVAWLESAPTGAVLGDSD